MRVRESSSVDWRGTLRQASPAATAAPDVTFTRDV
jgi:hypothetical protein